MSGGDQRHDVACGPHQHALFVAAREDIVGARRRLAGAGLKLDPRHQAEITNIDHMRPPAQAVRRVLEIGRDLSAARSNSASSR